MDRVEEGIANFRAFQVDARDFFSRADERATAEMTFHNQRDQEIKDALAVAAHRTDRWMLFIAILSLIAVSVGVYVGVREYQHKLSSVRSPTVVQSVQPQDAGLPQSYDPAR